MQNPLQQLLPSKKARALRFLSVVFILTGLLAAPSPLPILWPGCSHDSIKHRRIDDYTDWPDYLTEMDFPNGTRTWGSRIEKGFGFGHTGFSSTANNERRKNKPFPCTPAVLCDFHPSIGASLMDRRALCAHKLRTFPSHCIGEG